MGFSRVLSSENKLRRLLSKFPSKMTWRSADRENVDHERCSSCCCFCWWANLVWRTNSVSPRCIVRRWWAAVMDRVRTFRLHTKLIRKENGLPSRWLCSSPVSCSVFCFQFLKLTTHPCLYVEGKRQKPIGIEIHYYSLCFLEHDDTVGACLEFYYGEHFPKKLYIQTVIGSHEATESRINHLIDGVRLHESDKYFQILWLTQLEFQNDEDQFSLKK